MTETLLEWPVYVLSLVGDQMRRAPLLASLDVLGISYEVVVGVDGRRALPNELESLVDREAASRRHGRYLTDGEIACALSHRSIYSRIVEEGLPGAIVLEDDSTIDSRLQAFIRGRFYEFAHLIMLDHSHARVRGNRREILSGVQAARLSLVAYRTNGYSVSAVAAQWLLEVSSPLRGQADWPGDITEIGAVVLIPPIINHPSINSGISHLDAQRNACNPGTPTFRQSASRFLSYEFWRRWTIKRLSKRVS